MKPKQEDNSIIKDDYNYTVRTIKFFSNYKNESEIELYVKSHMNEVIGVFFIHNQPIEMIQLIEEGIIHFRKIKSQTIKS